MTDAERDRAFNKKVTEIVRGRTALLRDTRAEVVRLLNEALAQIRATLAGAPSDYQRWSLPRLAAEISRSLAGFSEAAAAKVSTAAGDAWQRGQDLIEQPLEAAGVRVSGTLPLLDNRQLMAMRAFMSDRIKDIGLAAANKINAELGLVVIGARTPSDAIGSVTQILREQSRARATTIVRTELGRVFSVANHERALEVVKIVPGMKKMWRRSGRLHPRLHHDLADGQVRAVGAPFVLNPFGRPQVKLMFPHDPKAPASETINCGCYSRPYMDHWKMATPGRTPGPDSELGPSVRELLKKKAA